MADPERVRMWRDWLRARFGGRLEGERLEAAAADCEALRAVWGPLLEAPDTGLEHELDNGDVPFPNPLPSADGTGRP